MKQSIFSNAYNAQQAQNNAIVRARETLKAQGITYPTKTSDMSVIEFYDAMQAYGKEAALIAKLLNPTPEPRPIIEFGRPHKEWSPFND